MSYFIATRRFDRGDYYQQIAPWAIGVITAISSGGASIWMAAVDAENNAAARSPDAPRFDVRQHDWSDESGWVSSAADRVTQTWLPAITAELSYRSDLPWTLDPRFLRDATWNWQLGLKDPSSEPAIRWVGIWTQQLGSGTRPESSPWLDSRRGDTPTLGWVRPVLDPIVGSWASIFRSLGSERSTLVPAIDVRVHEWSTESGWLPRAADQVINTWATNFDPPLGSERIAAGPVLDEPRSTWEASTAWITIAAGAVSPLVATWVPAFQADGNVRSLAALATGFEGRFQNAWPPLFGRPFDADAWQQVPAWLQASGLPYDRLWARAGLLDVRPSETLDRSGLAPLLDQTVRLWGPAFAAQRASERSAGGQRLELRGADWSPLLGWVQPVTATIIQSWTPAFAPSRLVDPWLTRSLLDLRSDWSALAWLTAALPSGATIAQQWPAVLLGTGLSFLPPSPAPLALPGSLWASPFSWSQGVTDAIVQTWMPAIVTPSLATAWPIGGRVLGLDAPLTGWVFAGLPPDATLAQQLPAWLQAAGLSYRSADRIVWESRGLEWAPSTAWVRTVLIVPPTVAQWAPAVWLASGRHVRSDPRPPFDVRGAYEWYNGAGAILASFRAAAAQRFVTPRTVPPFEYPIVTPTGQASETYQRFFLKLQADLQAISPHNTGGAMTAGQVTLVNGTATVPTTAIRATSLIFFQRVRSAGIPGVNPTYTILPGTSFTVQTDNAGDLSTFAWWAIEPS